MSRWSGRLLGTNYTYKFQLKDQIRSYYYFPSLYFYKVVGAFGSLKIDSRTLIPISFSTPVEKLTFLIGDWFKANHSVLRRTLDKGLPLPPTDAVLINGEGLGNSCITFEPGPAAFRPQAHAGAVYHPSIENGHPVPQGLLAIDQLAKEVLSASYEYLCEIRDCKQDKTGMKINNSNLVLMMKLVLVLSFFASLQGCHGSWRSSWKYEEASITPLNKGFVSGSATPSNTNFCVAMNNVLAQSLQVALDFACGVGGADCTAIRQGGPCF